jgi:5-formyltetrahydrofolate cyclo-ligase
MGENIQDAKAALRRQVYDRLKAMTPAQRGMASANACRLLGNQAVWSKARAILLYAPMLEELDVWPLVADSLAAGRTVALPRFDPSTKQYSARRIRDLTRDVRVGHFGIREPAAHCAAFDLGRLDLVLVPGVAFDARGCRLGRGKGYYDQLLTQVRGATCGVAFDEQIVAEVPAEPHDVHVYCILTPTRWIER